MAAGSSPKKATKRAPAKQAPSRPASATKRYTVQRTVVISADMDAAIVAFAEEHGVTSSEAFRVFLEYGRPQAHRYTKGGLSRAS